MQQEDGELVKELDYKGYHVKLYIDDYGQSYYFKFTDRKGIEHEESGGSFNVIEDEDIKFFIDTQIYDGDFFENLKKRNFVVIDRENEALIKLYEKIFNETTGKNEADVKKYVEELISECDKKLQYKPECKNPDRHQWNVWWGELYRILNF